MSMIIGISGMMYDKETGTKLGPAGTGKDTVADMLVAKYGFVKVSLADEIKRTAMRWYGFTEEQLWGPSELRATPSPLYPHLICRDVLQKLGTEVGREIYLDTWVDITIKVAKRLAAGDCYYDRVSGLRYFPTTDMARGRSNVVIPDVRWAAGNEGKAILTAGGYLWRVTRHGIGLQGAAGKHASETAALEEADTPFGAVLGNDGTLEELAALVDDRFQAMQRLNDYEKYGDMFIPISSDSGPTSFSEEVAHFNKVLLAGLGVPQHLLADRQRDVKAGRILPYDEEQTDVPPCKRTSRS